MKLATYSDGQSQRVGVVRNDDLVLDIAAAAEAHGYDDRPFLSMLDLIEASDKGLDIVRALEEGRDNEAFLKPVSSVRLLPPIPLPPQIRDFTVFSGHVVGAPIGMRKLAARLAGEPEPSLSPGGVPEVYAAQPIYYISNRFSVAGHDDVVVWPRYSQYMDFELEFAAILSRGGRNIRREEAHRYIFGYTIYNDFSARDAQLKEMAGMLGPAKGKSFDGGNVFGPWIVTADEIKDSRALRMEARVNGKVWASGDSSGMLHSFEDMIEFVSRDETLHPGEIFGSGTMGGGCGLELNRYLSDGDVIELEVSGIGTLRNQVRIPSGS
ncbi:fumarylacetoacetate hydrolase family protein [Microvirga sp. 0TCS3.31]